MSTAQTLWLVLSSLLSGLVGVGVSTYYYRRYEDRKSKLETLKRFVGNRYDLKGDAFSSVLNEIFVVFHDSERVMDALSAHHMAVTSPAQSSEDEFLKLFKMTHFSYAHSTLAPVLRNHAMYHNQRKRVRSANRWNVGDV